MQMNNHVVYVPSQFAEDATKLAVRYAGGCTALPGAVGFWHGPDGLMRDDITLLQIFERGTLARDHVISRLFSGGELAVAYVTNGIPNIVESGEWAEAA